MRAASETNDQTQPTMADLLEESVPLRELRRGELVEGQVMRVDPEGILVSVGHKSEGVVPQREMRTLQPGTLSAMQIGQTIRVVVLDPGEGEGQAVLSLDRAHEEAAWDQLERLVETGGTVQGTITGFNRGGAMVDVEGIQGFVPLSQLVTPSGARLDDVLQERVGEQVTVKVKEVSRRRNRAVLSERAVVREQREDQKGKLLESLEEGEVRKGRVTGVSNFGAFVDLGGADGLIHISEMSWTPVASVEEVLQVGQEIDVYVLRVDREQRRIALSLRRLQPTPWDMAADRFVVGQVVTGTITRLTEFGAFARVEDTPVEGLIHVSELAEWHVRHPKEVVRIGETVALRIVSMDAERHRLGLSRRRVEEAPDGPTEWRETEPGLGS